MNCQLQLVEFSEWMRARQEPSSERPAERKMLAAFDRAVARILPGCRNLRPGEDDGNRSPVIERGGTQLPVRLLSAGERGVLAIVLGLTRRLAGANPGLNDPAAEAAAVVLIDEIELHLHPQRQRQIARDLAETFPKCQFIATTNSPQVIGEVERDRIHIVTDGEVRSPTRSFGVDSSQVLEEIMDTDPRTEKVEKLLSEINRTIREERHSDTRELLKDLSNCMGDCDLEVASIRSYRRLKKCDA